MLKALASHQCGLGSIAAQCLRCVVFVVALAFLRGFSRGSLVSFPHENQRSKFQFDQDRGPAWKLAKAGVGFSLIIVIYFNLLIYGDKAKRCKKFSCVEFDPISNCRIVGTALANCLHYNKEMNEHYFRVHQLA